MTTSGIRENTPDLWIRDWPWPEQDTHKHRRGHLGCVTGNANATGAARLAARAGLRIGAGLVTLISPPGAVLVNAAHSTAIMVKPFRDRADLEDLAASCACCLIGPAAGVNDDTAANVLTVLEHAATAVLDADALTVFEEAPERLFSAICKPAVLTPHEGEFRRIFKGLLEKGRREDAVLSAARKSGAFVLLKGARTLMASPDGQLIRNSHASPFLATAGSGDVLTGMIGGLLAQDMAPLKAMCAAAWLHGEAGRRFGPGLIAEDLPEALPGLLAEIYDTRA